MIQQARTAVLAWAITAAVSLCPARLEAHQIDLSNARIELKPDRTVLLEIALKGSDIDRVAGTKVFDPQSGLVDAMRLAASTAAIAAYVTTHAVVHGADGTPCKAPVASGWSVCRVGLAPTGKRRLVTAHPQSGRRAVFDRRHQLPAELTSS